MITGTSVPSHQDRRNTSATMPIDDYSRSPGIGEKYLYATKQAAMGLLRDNIPILQCPAGTERHLLIISDIPQPYGLSRV